MKRLRNRKLGVLTNVAAIKTTLSSHTFLTLWPSSRSPRPTFYLIPRSFCYKRRIIDKHATASVTDSTMHHWIKICNCVFPLFLPCKHQQQTTVVTSVVWQVSPFLFTCRPYVLTRHHSSASSERTDAGALMHTEGEAPASNSSYLRYDLHTWT